MSMSCSASSAKKCSIWISGHGYQPVSEQEQSVSMRTREQSQVKYNGLLDVFHLSMAGLANVTTEMGIIHKKFNRLKRTGDFLTHQIVELLHDRSTEYATLTWLVQKIYDNQYDKCEENMVRLKLEQLIEEILILEQLASIEYAKFSPPTIIPNPTSNKVYSLKPNPGENTRRDDRNPKIGQVRSNPIRLKGNPSDNKLWAFYGLYFLDTSDVEHAYFSISNLPVDKNGFVDPEEIIKKNILTLSNYETFWSRHLDGRNYSGIPDIHVSDIGEDLEVSIVIFKEFCRSIGIAKPVPNQSVVIRPDIIASCIETLRVAVTNAADTIRHAITQLRESANIVSDARAVFKRTLASETAQQVENSESKIIIATIKKCIDDIIISSKEHIAIDIRIILKNIIMSNKLKNILKTAIFNKKISLNQIILFFSGLGYQELGIADPACFVAKPLKDPSVVDNTMQFDTQELYDSSFVPPPLFEDILNFIDSLNIKNSSVAIDEHMGLGGGTKRKRRMRIYSRKRRMRIYSRKRHARRRRYTRRRSR